MVYKFEVENLIRKLNSFKNKNNEDFIKFSKNINTVDKDLYKKHNYNLNKILNLEEFLYKLEKICKHKKL